MEMGPAGAGISWDSRVQCIGKCGNTLLVTLSYLSQKYAVYQYYCLTCRKQGNWGDLARSKIGYRKR